MQSMADRHPCPHPVPEHFAMKHNRALARAGSPSSRYLAHVRRNDDGSFAIHHLEEHLRAVGEGFNFDWLLCYWMKMRDGRDDEIMKRKLR